MMGRPLTLCPMDGAGRRRGLPPLATTVPLETFELSDWALEFVVQS